MTSRRGLRNLLLGSAASVAAMLAGTGASYADTVTTYVLDNGGSCCGTGPFGTVTVDQTGATSYSVTVDVNPNNLIATGNTNHFALSFESSQGSISNLGGATSGTSYSVFDNGSTSVDNDPFKGFDYAIQCSAGPTAGCGGTLTFDFTGTLTGGASSVFLLQTGTDSVGSVIFAGDIFCNQAGCNGKTGVVGSSQGSTAPLPGALALFAPVLGAGYIGLRRRRRQAARAAA